MKRNVIQPVILGICILTLTSVCIKQKEPSFTNRNQSTEKETTVQITEKEEEFYSKVKEELKKADIYPYDSSEKIPIVDFTLKSLDGKEISLSDFKGNTVLLNFWATWCGPCRREMPSMEELYKDLMNEGFVILGVNLRESRSTVQEFTKKYKLTFPILLDETGKIGSVYGAQSIPLSYLIDTEGYIVGAVIGTKDWNTRSVKDAILFIQNRGK